MDKVDFKGHGLAVTMERQASARFSETGDRLRLRLQRERQWIAVWLGKRYKMTEEVAKMIAARHDLGSPMFLYAKEWAVNNHLWNDD